MATVGICLVFELRKFRSAIHQGHHRLVATVNFGHKKPSRSWVVALVICQWLCTEGGNSLFLSLIHAERFVGPSGSLISTSRV